MGKPVIDMKEVRCDSLSCMSRRKVWGWAWVPTSQQEPWFCSKECSDAYHQEQLLELMTHQEFGDCDCPACQEKKKSDLTIPEQLSMLHIWNK